MLPEFLISAAGGVDIVNDDFNLLNAEEDKYMLTTPTQEKLLVTPSSPQTTNYSTYFAYSETPPLPTTNLISSNTETINIELEDSKKTLHTGISAWNNPREDEDFKSTRQLLQNSDDPFISRGVGSDDDNPNELKLIAAATDKTELGTSTCFETPKSTKYTMQLRNEILNSPGNKFRRKGTLKLRFHHQALPLEYLNHYKRTQNQKSVSDSNTSKSASSSRPENSSADIQKSVEKNNKAGKSVKDWLEKISQIQTNVSSALRSNTHNNENNDVSIFMNTPQQMRQYSDLPYMGEMTLDNLKPRRGRKPKKTDICHLIYKNYGTILPGTTKNKMKTDTKVEIRHSLLQKYLSKDKKEINDEFSAAAILEEPLNLCLRDQSSDFLPKSKYVQVSEELTSLTQTTQSIDKSGSATNEILSNKLKKLLSNNQPLLENISDDKITTSSKVESGGTYNPTCDDGKSVGFLHPMDLYYQKILDALGTNQTSSTCISTLKFGPNAPKNSQTLNINPRIKPQLMQLDNSDQDPHLVPTSTKSANLTSGGKSPKIQLQTAQKRRRSAIFIPPMPAENATNPATEVSICKFKFTGGVKPSLKEKKMLSVDSDGNYRYYNGTGDKALRGYEFFPRETLQQSGVVPGVNCSGAFLNATGEKISGDFPSCASSNNKLLYVTESSNSSLQLSSNLRTSPLLKPSSLGHHRHHHFSTFQSIDGQKKLSKRSMQREKLEKTFKEKGFLIQTQKLESAGGATYCKFRQLRKFTRYLFRSWKDYLPGDMQQVNTTAVAATHEENQQDLRI